MLLKSNYPKAEMQLAKQSLKYPARGVSKFLTASAPVGKFSVQLPSLHTTSIQLL